MVKKISSRLSIRRFEKNDLFDVSPLLTDAETVRYTGFRVPQTIDQIEALLKKWTDSNQGNLGVWAAIDHQIGTMVGWVMLRVIDQPDPELGFMFLKEYWGKGYATELAKGMLHYGFYELNLKRIVAAADKNNTASHTVLRKSGMVECAHPDPDPSGIYFEAKR